MKCNHHWVTKFGVTECKECGIKYDNCLDAHVTREQQIEYRIEYVSTLYKQNLNGRESEDEIFKEGIRAGIEETEEDMPNVIEKMWNQYRNITNNDDAWSFKEWIIEQFTNK